MSIHTRLPATAWWRLLAVAIALVLVGLAGAVVTPLPTEEDLLVALTEPRSPVLTTVAHVVTVVGDFWFVVAVAVVLAVLVRASPIATRLRLLLLLSIGGSSVIVSILKVTVARPRPPAAVITTLTTAYPSGHAIRATAVYGLLLWAAHRGIRRAALRYVAVAATMVLMGAISWSRIYLAVHLPSDVIVGMLLGAIWIVAVIHTVITSVPASSAASGAEERSPP